MKSIMEFNFAENSKRMIPRSAFYMPWGHKLTFNENKLYPFYDQLLLPGDEIKVRTGVYCRMTTPKYCIMDNLYLDMAYFKIPLRLLQTNFKRLVGHRDDPDDSIDFQTPIVNLSGTSADEKSLYTYFGLPYGIQDLEFQAYYGRAYNLVWNWWYRIQHCQDSVTVDLDDGPDDLADYELLTANKLADYFTTLNPDPQVGDEVELPIGSAAPIYGTGQALLFSDGSDLSGTIQGEQFDLSTSQNAVNQNIGTPITPSGQLDPDDVVGIATESEATGSMQGDTGIYTDLSSATAAGISQIRQAFAMQQLLELRARTGQRYPEIVIAEYGVKPETESYMPEYIGGGRLHLNKHQVVQQSASESGITPQGNISAYVDGFSENGFRTYAREWSIVIGLLCVRADLTYQDGVDRKKTWRTRDEMYTPIMANLSEQPVYMKELYVSGNPANWDNVIGYTERWNEFRFNRSRISGQFLSNATDTLHAYHLSEQLTAEPDITAAAGESGAFLPSDVPMGRIIATSDEDKFIADFRFEETNIRQMPMHSIPGLDRL